MDTGIDFVVKTDHQAYFIAEAKQDKEEDETANAARADEHKDNALRKWNLIDAKLVTHAKSKQQNGPYEHL